MIVKDVLFTFTKLPQIKIEGNTVSRFRIEKLLRRTGAKTIIICDDEYIIPHKSVIVDFGKLDYVKNRRWIANRFDCDNFAGSMYGTACEVLPLVAFGIVHVSRTREKDRHALNFCVLSDDSIWYFEPQQAQLFQDKTYIPEFFYV